MKKTKKLCLTKDGKKKLIIGSGIVLFILILVLALAFNKPKTEEKPLQQPEQKEPVNEDIHIIDLNSNSRPIAVMINNISTARPYQAGLQDAYLVYEMIVEGGITRMMAVFKDAETARIGSIRSSDITI